DTDLSSALPSLCAKGEGQAIEFKLDLPPQSHDIAKSIAAFASSNEGLLIYGVSDDGRIVGLSEADDPKWRDRTQQRLLSAAKEIKPPVHPSVRWACVDGRIACVVKVEKGLEPIYYSAYSAPSRTPFRADGGQHSAVIADSVPG
ncbi:MAG: hypothetical protein RLZZ584_3526, partial [Pseudomonadota bacterium]